MLFLVAPLTIYLIGFIIAEGIALGDERSRDGWIMYKMIQKTKKIEYMAFVQHI